MKSLNPSLRCVAIAAAAFAAGSFAFAQSSSASSSQGASNTANGSMQNSNDQSGSNSNWSATTSANNPSSNSNSNYNSSSNDQSSMSSNSDSRGSNKDKLSWGDRRFVKKAADDGQAEVALAQLAAQKATNPDVRQFAQQMINDHSQANQELMSLASQKNVKIDQDDSTKDRAYRRLSQASGNDFDREFVDHMVDEHEKDVRLFEKESQKAKDSDIRQFASTTLPKLREHLQHVQQLQQSIMPTGNEAKSGYSTRGSANSDSSDLNSSSSSSSGNNANSSSVNSSSASSSPSSSSSSSTK